MTMTNITPRIHPSLFLALAISLLGCADESEPALIEIAEGERNLTMVNVWTPRGGVTVDELATAITAGIEADIRIQPGYVVTAVHRSLDDSNVLVFGHWLDQASLEGVGEVIGAGGAPAFTAAVGLADYTPRPYRVVAALEPSGPASVTIAEGGEFLTMVNTWTPREGATVDEVAAALQQAIGTEISQFPGFLAGGILASLDGSNVLVYGQWQDMDALAGVQAEIEAGRAPLFAGVLSLAESDAHPYSVEAVLAAAP